MTLTTDDDTTPQIVGFAPEDLDVAFRVFSQRFPAFDPDGSFAVLRQQEYGRLDDEDQVYLDYTGGGLHARSQLESHLELLKNRVLGNPHSNNPTSQATTALVEATRQAVLDYFGAQDEYLCVFTANASAALRLVGESYPFAPGGRFAVSTDNHNSVNGIREFARRAGAAIDYVPVVAPELRIDDVALGRALAAADPSACNLFAYPAQSNFSGVQHSLDLVERAHAAGWDVVLDAAAFVPTNRLDLTTVKPDFVSLSFYKMFGFPTGVGALLLRQACFDRLRRPWFAGGTVTIASVEGDGHYFHRDEAAFEDGTVDYLNIPAVSSGLQHLQRVDVDAIHRRIEYLGSWLLESLLGLRHSTGQPAVVVYGPTDTVARGGTITFTLYDCEGRPIDDRRVEELANEVNISLRTGCFCNPGANEAAHHLTAGHMREWFERGEPMTFLELRQRLDTDYGRLVAATRISMGMATNFSDVYRFMGFIQGFVDRTIEEIGETEIVSDNCRTSRDST